jgi:hypothetical protein
MALMPRVNSPIGICFICAVRSLRSTVTNFVWLAGDWQAIGASITVFMSAVTMSDSAGHCNWFSDVARPMGFSAGCSRIRCVDSAKNLSTVNTVQDAMTQSRGPLIKAPK